MAYGLLVITGSIGGLNINTVVLRLCVCVHACARTYEREKERETEREQASEQK